MLQILDERPVALSADEAPPVTARVLHVINGEFYSGAERVQDLLALRLPEMGFEVGFACLKPGKFAAARQSRRTPLVDLAMRGRWDLRASLAIARLVEREDYALIHAHTPRSAVVGRIAAKRAGVPFVYHVHSPASRDTTRGLQNRVNAIVERASLTGAAALITVSASLREHMLKSGFPQRAIHVVKNGVPRRGDVLFRSTPDGVWTLGTMALFRPRKGIEVLLEALAILQSERAPVRLMAVGGFEAPQYEAEVKSVVAKLGIEPLVEWSGFTHDVNATFDRMDLFVLPSLFGEGIPMVVLEAMASGVPVVATRVEGVPEAIRDGADGLLVEPSDPRSLAVAIGRFVSGELDWRAMSGNALDRQARDFSDESMAAGVADVYRKVLGVEARG